MQETELILNADQSVYHLNLKVGELASKIIFVGDPKRARRIADRFDHLEIQKQKREFHTFTGILNGQALSVISTGIGTDNIDIVWNELDALFNIDFESRQIKSDLQSVQVLRLGTCGGMQAHIQEGSMVSSRFAIGGDGLMPFYIDSPKSLDDFEQKLNAFSSQHLKGISLYGAAGDIDFHTYLAQQYPDVHHGITYTAAGFYGPQGRSLGRIPVRFPNLPDTISSFEFNGIQVLNMEMETAGILGLGMALGHRAASLSVILANRHTRRFVKDPHKTEGELIDTGLAVLLNWT